MSGKLNKNQAFKIYGIRGNATILYWIRQYQGMHWTDKPQKELATFAEMKKNINDKKLEEENKELRELLRVAELRADLWQHAIEIAESIFGIEISKKCGAQPFKASKDKDPKKNSLNRN